MGLLAALVPLLPFLACQVRPVLAPMLCKDGEWLQSCPGLIDTRYLGCRPASACKRRSSCSCWRGRCPQAGALPTHRAWQAAW